MRWHKIDELEGFAMNLNKIKQIRTDFILPHNKWQNFVKPTYFSQITNCDLHNILLILQNPVISALKNQLNACDNDKNRDDLIILFVL